MIEINRNPSHKELRLFGAMLPLFFGVIGALVLVRHGPLWVAACLWSAGIVLAGLFFLLPTLRRPVYLGWLCAAYPIGWTISHLIMIATYYLVVTPIGLSMRLLGKDPLSRRFKRQAETYWIPHQPAANLERYFRQF